jgi:hypothetical protein
VAKRWYRVTVRSWWTVVRVGLGAPTVTGLRPRLNDPWGILAGREALALLSRVDGAWGLSDGLLDACECAGGGGASG